MLNCVCGAPPEHTETCKEFWWTASAYRTDFIYILWLRFCVRSARIACFIVVPMKLLFSMLGGAPFGRWTFEFYVYMYALKCILSILYCIHMRWMHRWHRLDVCWSASNAFSGDIKRKWQWQQSAGCGVQRKLVGCIVQLISLDSVDERVYSVYSWENWIYPLYMCIYIAEQYDWRLI